MVTSLKFDHVPAALQTLEQAKRAQANCAHAKRFHGLGGRLGLSEVGSGSAYADSQGEATRRNPHTTDRMRLSRRLNVGRVLIDRNGPENQSAKVPDLALIGAAELHSLARIERQKVFSVDMRMNLGHRVDVDHSRTMNTLKHGRIQHALKLFHGCSQDMCLTVCVNTHVVTRGFDGSIPVKLLQAHGRD